MKFNQIQTRLAKQAKAGFSLVELLVVIAVIGILAAIAIPALSNVFESSTKAKNQRNMQMIVGMYNAARAAGATTTSLGVNSDPGGAYEAVRAVAAALSSSSATPVTGSGPFATTTFTVSQLSDSDISNAAAYSTWSNTNKQLGYNAADTAAVAAGAN